MGIKDLGQIINKYENTRGIIYFKYLKGKTIAVDISVVENRMLYGAFNHQYKKRGKESGDDDMDENEAETRFLVLIIELAISFLEHGILPVFLFDGARRPEKKDENDKREASRDKTEEEIKKIEKRKKAGKSYDKEKLYKLKSRKKVTKEHNEKVKKVLKYLGFTCLTATFDAEKLCVMLCLEGKCDAVYSNDSDCLALGCPFMLTGHKSKTEGGKKIKYFEYIQLKYILKGLGMKQKKFLHLCIMLGCDFNPRIKGNGVAGCLKYMENHNKISEKSITKSYDDVNSEEFLCTYKRSLEIFAPEKSEDCCIDEDMTIGINIDLEFLREKLEEYSLDFLTEKIVTAIEDYHKKISNI